MSTRKAVRPRRLPTKRVAADGTCKTVRFSWKKAHEICEWLAKGQSWLQICQTENMPAYSTFYTWQREKPEFAQAVQLARTMGADALADEALAKARASTPATVQSDKLLVTTLMGQAGKIAPRSWGTKADEAPAPKKVQQVLISVRRFERAVRPDGTTYVREVEDDEGDAA
jgi:hypothetical protein